MQTTLRNTQRGVTFPWSHSHPVYRCNNLSVSPPYLKKTGRDLSLYGGGRALLYVMSQTLGPE